MDTTKSTRLTHGAVTTWENGSGEANAGHCAKLQITADARWVGGVDDRAEALSALAEMLERTAKELRGLAAEVRP